MGWGCSSVINCLPNMCEALGSIPSTTKNIIRNKNDTCCNNGGGGETSRRAPELDIWSWVTGIGAWRSRGLSNQSQSLGAGQGLRAGGREIFLPGCGLKLSSSAFSPSSTTLLPHCWQLFFPRWSEAGSSVLSTPRTEGSPYIPQRMLAFLVDLGWSRGSLGRDSSGQRERRAPRSFCPLPLMWLLAP